MYETDWKLLKRLQITPKMFEGKVVLMTGSGRGLGEATLTTLADLGAKVIVVDKRPYGKAVAEAICKRGGKAVFLQCDVRNLEDLKKMQADALSAFGKVDILVNSCCEIVIKPMIAITLEEWESAFWVHTRAAFLNIKAFLPGMLERKNGVVLNIISHDGSALSASYAASKLATRSMALVLSKELPPDSGVASYAFMSGVFDSPFLMEDIIPGIAKLVGAKIEDITASLNHVNPGYTGIAPTKDMASGLVYTLLHASEYHGQIADPYEPLNRFGIIDVGKQDRTLTEQQFYAVAGGFQKIREQIDRGMNESVRHIAATSALNADLERRITLKTKEVNELLENMHQGIFTIGPNGRINLAYSKYLAKIFETETIANVSATEFLFQSSNLNDEERSQASTVIDASIGESIENYETNSHLLPSTIEKTTPSGKAKNIELYWYPISEKGVLEKLMVVCRDVTELKNLEKENTLHRIELERIGQVLQIGQDRSRQFFDSATGLLKEIQDEINAPTPNSGLLFRNMHTLKGNARGLNFKEISLLAHRSESRYAELRSGEKVSPAALQADFNQVKSAVDNYLGCYERLYSVEKKSGSSQTKHDLFFVASQLSSLVAEVSRATKREIPTIQIAQAPGFSIPIQLKSPLHDSLVHLIRNSVDHGIEPPQDRLKAGKPSVGLIRMSGIGNTICYSDDGRGLNLKKLRTGRTASDLEVAKSIFTPGVSTAERVSEISGRGVGMDAVKTFLEKQNCKIELKFTDQAEGAEYRPFEIVIQFPNSV